MTLLISADGFADAARLTMELVDQKPHFAQSFTQGLIVNGDEITESSGLYGQSVLVRYSAKDNHLIKKLALADNYFAEGTTQVGDKLYLLTWKEQKVFIINAETFTVETTLPYDGEGWGITYDGKNLITSSGSDQLVFRDPHTFKVVRSVTVHEGERRWNQINELEFSQGYVWANVWQDTVILAIDPKNGEVKGKLDLSDLVAKNNHTPYSSVLNGIAYDAQAKAFWITGKLWPNRYLVKMIWPQSTAKSPSIPTQSPARNNPKIKAANTSAEARAPSKQTQ
jgi:glutamine cyclotransferase